MKPNEINDVLDTLIGDDEINDFTGMTDEERMFDDDTSLRAIPNPAQTPIFNSSLSPPLIAANSDENEEEYVERYEVSTFLNSFLNGTNTYTQPQQQYMYNPYTYNDYYRR